MAELLYWIAEPAGVDPGNPQQYHRGDVIVCMPDGHPWSERERTHPRWGILRADGADPAELVHLVVPDEDQGRIFAKRVNSLDLDNAAVAGKRDVTLRDLQAAGRVRQTMRVA